MAHEGFVKIYRKILENPVVCKDTDYFSVWMYLLLNATHKELPALFNGKKIVLMPGQLITGRVSIAKALHLTDSKVQRILKTFENEQQIEQQTRFQNRLITILNWSVYQKSEQRNEQRLNSDRTANEQRLNTNKKAKKAKNEKKERNSYCPELKLPTEPPVISFVLNDKSEYPVYERQITEWREAYPAADIRRELFKMKAWLDANPRKRKTKAGILRFVVNWLSRAQDKGGDGTEDDGWDEPEYEYWAPTPEDDAPFERYIPENATYEDILPPAEEVFRW